MQVVTWAKYTAGIAMTAVVLLGCEKSATGPSSGVAAEHSLPSAPAPADAATVQAFLAYEHTVQLQLPAGEIAPRISAVTEACQQGRFGACAVLEVSQTAGDSPSGAIQLRVVPTGVEPLIGLASDKGQLVTRTTQAEDLAQAVADTALAQARLRNEHERLQQFQRRTDIKVEDLLTLSRRMAEIEAELQSANRDAAQQQRRISTQLLRLHFQSTSAQRSRSEIGSALSESGAIFTTSLAYLVRFVAGVLPVVLLLAVLGWAAGRWLRRWRRRKLPK